LEPASGICVP